MWTMRVLIAGAGLGGLTLAHGLRQAGLTPVLFERGSADWNLTTSYRIHIDATGSRALHRCLPPDLWRRFESRSAAPPRGIAFATEHLQQLAFIPDAAPPDDPAAHAHPISRAGLRQLLLEGLEDAVTYDKHAVRFEQSADQVTLHFADGTFTRGDVLVGADGSASAVRKQLLPHARVVDTGVVGIGGKVYLDQRVREEVGPRLLSQMTMLLPPRDVAMFVAPFVRTTHPADPEYALDLPEHLFWVVIGRAERVLGNNAHPRQHSAADLRHRAFDLAAGWHPLLRSLIMQADADSLTSVPLHTSQPVTAWQPTRVTMLGDAIHTMTPLQGLGGNTALRDAAVLCHELTSAYRSQSDVVAAIGAYEAAMRVYGFQAVEQSLQITNSIASSNLLGRLAFRTVLRAATIPWINQRLFQRPAVAFPAAA
jgi:2-polyprenyl-6-methoxyphenol hydroxylase-like FAD-dependent oxidoreductase